MSPLYILWNVWGTLIFIIFINIGKFLDIIKKEIEK